MVLANTTSIGMQPNVHETPAPKVASHISYSDNKIILLSSMHVHCLILHNFVKKRKDKLSYLTWWRY